MAVKSGNNKIIYQDILSALADATNDLSMPCISSGLAPNSGVNDPIKVKEDQVEPSSFNLTLFRPSVTSSLKFANHSIAVSPPWNKLPPILRQISDLYCELTKTSPLASTLNTIYHSRRSVCLGLWILRTCLSILFWFKCLWIIRRLWLCFSGHSRNLEYTITIDSEALLKLRTVLWCRWNSSSSCSALTRLTKVSQLNTTQRTFSVLCWQYSVFNVRLMFA